MRKLGLISGLLFLSSLILILGAAEETDLKKTFILCMIALLCMAVSVGISRREDA